MPPHWWAWNRNTCPLPILAREGLLGGLPRRARKGTGFGIESEAVARELALRVRCGFQGRHQLDAFVFYLQEVVEAAVGRIPNHLLGLHVEHGLGVFQNHVEHHFVRHVARAYT